MAPGTTVGIDQSNNTIQVGNAATNPVIGRDVDNPARNAFLQKISIKLDTGVLGLLMSNAFTVPTGKRLVIEYVSANSKSVPTGQGFALGVVPSFNSGQNILAGDFFFVATRQGTNPFNQTFDIFGLAEQTRMYADGSVGISLFRSGTAATGDIPVSITISGYLIDIP